MRPSRQEPPPRMTPTKRSRTATALSVTRSADEKTPASQRLDCDSQAQAAGGLVLKASQRCVGAQCPSFVGYVRCRQSCGDPPKRPLAVDSHTTPHGRLPVSAAARYEGNPAASTDQTAVRLAAGFGELASTSTPRDAVSGTPDGYRERLVYDGLVSITSAPAILRGCRKSLATRHVWRAVGVCHRLLAVSNENLIIGRITPIRFSRNAIPKHALVPGGWR